MSKSGKNPYHIQGISFPSERLLEEAKKRARSFGISLSNYVCQLVKNDLDDAEAVIVRARPDPQENQSITASALNESASASGVSADKLRRAAISDFPGQPASPAVERKPEEQEGVRSRRKFVGTVRRGAAEKEDRREKRGK